nr:hypothetical protein HK105_006252 [Polyrhizophydium stewartii]
MQGEAHLPKFVSKQVRALCKRRQATQQRHAGGGASAGGGIATRRNSVRAGGAVGSMISLGRIRPQQSASLRESLADGYPSLLGSSESVGESLSSDLGDMTEPPEIEETAGACAVIEIVGYSALIETLGQRGNVPSQLVARSLESYFSKIIDIIEDCHGDVVKMVGDTLVVCWRCNELDVESQFVTTATRMSGGNESPNGQNGSSRFDGNRTTKIVSSDDDEEENEEVDYFMGDSHEFKPKHTAVSDTIMTAVMCCMMCINFLSQSEIWALEDISPEFTGLKFVARCAVGAGSIIDSHVGVRGIRMDNILIGAAYSYALECTKDAIQPGEVALHTSATDVVASRLRTHNIAFTQRGPHAYVLDQPPAGLSELQSSMRLYVDSIVYADVPVDANAATTLLENYISDGAAFYLRSLRRQRRGLSMFSGNWTRTTVIAIRFMQALGTITTHRVGSSLPPQQSPIISASDALEYSKEVQKLLAIVIKNCRSYNMILHRVMAHADSSLTILCAIGGVWSGNEKVPLDILHQFAECIGRLTFMVKEREMHAVKMALSTRDALSRSILRGEAKVNFLISSNTAYEGLLINRHRCDFRLVGEFINKVEETMYEVAPKSSTIPTSKTFSRFQDLSATAPAKDSLAFREEIEKVHRACLAASNTKDHITIMIEGSQGSGKTFLVNRARTILDKMGFAMCVSEAHEHESYRHPLYPYTLIVPQLLDLIEMIDSRPECSVNNSKDARAAFKAGSASAMSFSAKRGGMNATSARPQSAITQLGHSMFGVPRSILPKLAVSGNSFGSVESNSIKGSNPSMQQPQEKPGVSPATNKARFKFAKFIKSRNKAKVAPLETNSGSLLGEKSAFRGDEISSVMFSDVQTRRAQIGLALGASINGGGLGASSMGGAMHASLTETLRNCLLKAGEDPDATLPLLNVVILPEIAETKETKNLGPDGRTYLLAGLIVRFIKLITQTTSLAIIIDDVQWMDSASWQITMQIIRRCEKALVLLAGSSTNDYRGTLMSQVKEMNQTETIELRGWTTGDVERYLNFIFGERARRVDKEIIDSVKSVCEGTPAHIECMGQFLIDFNCLGCSAGEVTPIIDTSEFEFRLPSSFASLILWQYDSLRSKEFQRFLRCAATVGRFFSLEEVAAIWNEAGTTNPAVPGQSDDFSRQASVQRLAALVQIYDTYGMIEQRVIEEQFMDPNYPFRTTYAFHHSATREIIYNERMSEPERKARHLKLIRFYERQLTDDTEAIYIPLICFHHRGAALSDRTSVLKRIQYMVMLGNYLCMVAEAFIETREVFNEIENIVSEFNLADDLGSSIISELHVRLGAAHSHGISDQISKVQGLKHLLIAINLLDFAWPKTDTEWWTMVWLQGIMWGCNNIIGKHAKPRTHKPNKLMVALGRERYSMNKYLDRLERLEPVLDLMSRHLFETDARLRDQIGCDLLCLNVAFSLGRHVSKARIRLLTSMALKFWFAGHLKLALFIAERCKLLQDQLGEEAEDPLTLASSTSFLTACGRWKDARKWAIRGMDVCQRVGAHQRCFMLIYDGKFKEALELEKLRGHESRMNGASFGALWSDAVVAQILLLQGDTLAALRSRIDMDRHYKLVPPQLRAQFQGIFAQLELVDGNFDACLGCIERVIELIPKIHYSNNQVFYGVLLGVLAMYSMIERNTVALIRPRRAQRSLTSRSNTRVPRPSMVPGGTPLAGGGGSSVGGGGSAAMREGFSRATRSNSMALGLPSMLKTSAMLSVTPAASSAASSAATSPSATTPQGSDCPSPKSNRQPPAAPPRGRRASLGSLPSVLLPIPLPAPLPMLQAGVTSPPTPPVAAGTSAGAILSPSSSESSSLNLNLAGVLSATSLSVDRTRIRRLGMTLITVLQPFQGHALCEPMLLLVRGLIRALDSSAMPGLLDAPTALRDWAHKLMANPDGDMRFMVGVLAIKSWRVSAESAEWESERRLAEQIFTELGIEGCLKIL